MITADYGTRQPDYPAHKGIDFISSNGLQWVISASDGVVIAVNDGVDGFSDVLTAGNYVKIENEDGTVSRYLHLEKNTIAVKVGQAVSKGDKIGIMGESGLAYGKHLHFDLQKDGDYIDPLNWLTEEQKEKQTNSDNTIFISAVLADNENTKTIIKVIEKYAIESVVFGKDDKK